MRGDSTTLQALEAESGADLRRSDNPLTNLILVLHLSCAWLCHCWCRMCEGCAGFSHMKETCNPLTSWDFGIEISDVFAFKAPLPEGPIRERPVLILDKESH